VRKLAILFFLAPLSAFAASPAPSPPTLQEQMSQAKIQIGQLLVIQGNLELKMDKLQAENEALKKQLDASKPDGKPSIPAH